MMAFYTIVKTLNILLISQLLFDCEAVRINLGPNVTVKRREVVSVTGNLNLSISNGGVAPTGLYDFIVRLKTTKNTFNSTTLSSCSGVLISKNFVLTSAYCVYCSTAITALVGSSATAYVASEWITHYDYFPQSDIIRNDIGLVRLKNPVTSVKPISLKSPSISLPGQTATVCGWGETELADYSNVLMCGQVVVETVRACMEFYYFVHPTYTLCIVSKTESPITNICYGDYGGPVLIDNKLYGITSFSADCLYDYPAGFSVIAGYSSWITSMMKMKTWTPPQASTACPPGFLNFNYILID